MTATEVSVRYELMQRLLGPTFGRLKSDLLDKVVRRTFNILFRAGQFPATPQIVRDAQAELDIQYVGPMARAQKAERVGAIERYTQNVVALATAVAPLAPEKAMQLLDNIDPLKIPRELAELLGVPIDLLPTEGDVEKARKQREQMQAQMQEIQAAQAAGDAGKSLGEAAQVLRPVEDAA